MGHELTTELETTARKLAAENTMSWLVCDVGNPDKVPFTNRSPFHTISTMGTKGFMDRIKLFPPRNSALTQRGKPIRNTDTLITTLQDLVAGRKTEKVYCSLCFSTFWPASLNPACGRRGCLQRICTGCLCGWYGSNTSGCIINTAALACPFCRRLPTPRTLAKYGMGLHAVRDLHRALVDKGTWIYAWCSECFTAKKLVERSCARGMPPEVTDWKCLRCIERLEVERLEAERRAIQQALDDARAAEDLERQQDVEGRRRAVEETLEASRLAAIKRCPGCDTMCERVAGCGHITCPIPGCHTYWCYFCGKEFPQGAIYKHMSYAHGGMYGDDWVNSE
ncbi:hypothetical protein RU639_013716 [Aspergillus parasiticus]